MKYRYQLILLGSIEDSIVEEIKTQIILEITNLKLPEGILNIIDRSNWEEDYVGINRHSLYTLETKMEILKIYLLSTN